MIMTSDGVSDNQEYRDAFNTCASTSVALRIMHATLQTDEITQMMGIQPSWKVKKGEYFPDIEGISRTGIWGLSSEEHVHSRDARRHIDWLIARLADKRGVLEALKERGYTVDCCCDWVRSGGTGGPILSPRNMAGLSELGIDLWFEFWNDPEDGGEELMG